MGLFKKKIKEEISPCSCGNNCDSESKSSEENLQTGSASVKILGTGCAKCNKLEASTKEALQQLGMDTAIDHVTDVKEIMAYGVMMTPALVVDGKVLSYGKVLKVEDVVKLLNKTRG